MNNRENKSRINHQAWRGLKDDNGEGLDWLNPFAYTEASQYTSNYTRPLAHFISEVHFDIKFGGGSSGKGDERYYT